VEKNEKGIWKKGIEKHCFPKIKGHFKDASTKRRREKVL
jgi:hypothetical protein